MSTDELVLGPRPEDPRSQDLWLQHAAGHLIFRDVRGYALASLDPDLDDHTREVATKAIDDAVYGLMQAIDGIEPPLRNSEYEVTLRTLVRLSPRDQWDVVIQEIDLFEGDGMCMGYHGWLEGDFGEDPVAIPAAAR